MSNKYVDEIVHELDIHDGGEVLRAKHLITKAIRKAQLDGELTALENLKTDLGAYPDHPKYWHIRNIDDRIEQINKLKAELGEKDEQD